MHSTRAEAPGLTVYPTSSTRRATARTIYGACGVKIWIFKGEILERPQVVDAAPAAPARNA